MGGGKRNYNAMRLQFRKKITKDMPTDEIEQKPPSPEATKDLLELWKKMQEKQQKNKQNQQK